ncbi:DUF5815 family protein [Natrarchaeobaculum aegyptiacum]|uniref:Uncharacterized protein n=1 Tax=Natrarchaeobaculum aegyptiacum TaxID=745377 RepID=A0A2Z2HS95_9EURY|nr:DUF5815 family protein [Natrarchaeobaculum aegyptiacum]ARS90020.1 hypothetical protein B1756_09960 [Natrarchaeobaculum aegyptiacum]
MATPRVPGPPDDRLEVPCGETVDPHEIDLGTYELQCDCGERHAVVLDPHPLSRFVPESLVAVLEEVIETDDEFETFSTPHLMAIVAEDNPDDVAVYDASDDGAVGYALLWVTDPDAREFHERVVDRLLELMDHAIGHAEDADAKHSFQRQLEEFDVPTFVEQYRAERDFESERDVAR